MGETAKTAPLQVQTSVNPFCLTPEEAQVFQRMNEDRIRFSDEYVRFGKGQKRTEVLKVDCDLVQSARAYSKEMALRHFFGHVNPDGKNWNDRICAQTSRFQMTGENIVWWKSIYDPANILDGAEEAFMNYPAGQDHTHRAVLLNPDFTHAGVGVFAVDNGNGKKRVYVTQHFGGFPKY